ncbi:MAG: hypothetical protein E6447_14475, partial [Bradyrhizobium sp.]|nr:hypothetical protein [Bradyrhizobium sp.]
MSDPASGQGPNASFELNVRPAAEVAQEIMRSGDDLHVDPAAPPEPMLEAAVSRWRVAKSLERLRAQVNA